MTVRLLGSLSLHMQVVSDDNIDFGAIYVLHLHLRGFLSLMTLYNSKYDFVQYVLSAHMDIVAWQVDKDKENNNNSTAFQLMVS